MSCVGIRDIVDRCRVWESHADSDVRRISKPGPDRAFPTYVVSDSEMGTDDRRVAGNIPVYVAGMESKKGGGGYVMLSPCVAVECRWAGPGGW